MYLSDRDICSVLQRVESPLVVTPLGPEALQAASIDIRLGSGWLRQRRLRGWRRLFARHHGRGFDAEYGQVLVLRPGDFVLATTLEYVVVPADLVLEVSGKSTTGRNGVLVHMTAGWIDPGFQGNITLEMYNCGHSDVMLAVGRYVAQLKVAALSSPAEHPYRGRYQGQVGATPARNHVRS